MESKRKEQENLQKKGQRQQRKKCDLTTILFPLTQVWRHGTKNHSREDFRVYLLTERSLGHRATRACDRV